MTLIKFQTALICGFLYLFLCGAGNCSAQNARQQIAGKLNELKQGVAQMKLDEGQSQGYLRYVSRADSALQSDYLFLSLFYLQQAWMMVRPDEFSVAKAEFAKQGMAGFDVEWKKVAGELKSKTRILDAKAGSHPAMAAQALIETALTVVGPYHQSSRLYALNADVGEALIYLGRAQAAMDFAVFCKNLQLPTTGNLISLPAIDAELKDLESKIVAAYKQPEAATKQRVFIQISVTLKTAEELNRENRFAGALVKYLDALLELTVQETPVPDEQKVLSLKSQSETLGKRLSSSDTDASLGVIYGEMSAYFLKQNSTDGESLKRAAAIIEKVLPAYFKITQKEK